MSGVNLKFKSELNGEMTMESLNGETSVTFRPDGTVVINSLGPIQITGIKRGLMSDCEWGDHAVKDLERDLRKTKVI